MLAHFHKLSRSLKKRGTFGTAVFTAMVIHSRANHRFSEWWFDTKWGVRTRGIMPPNCFKYPVIGSYAQNYQPTPPRAFDRIMQVLNLDPTQFMFFDLGCGKGRALLLASQYRFQKVVGVEFDTDHVRQARANISSARHRLIAPCEVVCEEASEYIFPAQNGVMFFFNPFKEPIMRNVLRNLVASAQGRFQRVLVVYGPLTALLQDSEFESISEIENFSIYKLRLG